LEDTFQQQGFEVLGFLSNDFADQGGDGVQIDMCKEQYAVSFPQFNLDHVIPGPMQVPQPVWAWLEAEPNPGPWPSPLPAWNFNKYLISRHGQLMAHWDQTVYPGKDPTNPSSTFDNSAIVIAIQAELAKP
jgi:glutathione peroxidase